MDKIINRQPQNVLPDIYDQQFNFDQWAKAVKPQLIAALRGNFTITPQQWKPVQQKQN